MLFAETVLPQQTLVASPPTSSSFCGFDLFRSRLRTAQRLDTVWLIRENGCLWVYKSWYLTLAVFETCVRWGDARAFLAQQTVHQSSAAALKGWANLGSASVTVILISWFNMLFVTIMCQDNTTSLLICFHVIYLFVIVLLSFFWHLALTDLELPCIFALLWILFATLSTVWFFFSL